MKSNEKTPTPVLTRVRLADILVKNRLRPVTEAGVAAILDSARSIGVKDPIHLRKRKDGSLHLIAGGHRHAAYAALGQHEIDAWVWSGITDDFALLIEIDDNLAGAEMGPLDSAIFLATRKRVYEKMHPETVAASGAALAAKRWNAADTMSVASFAKATAEKFGMSDRHVRRLIEAGERVAQHAHELRSAPRQVTLKDLMEIAKISEPVERYDVVRALRDGSAKSAAEARRQLRPALETAAKDPVEEGFKALLTLWERAPAAARRRFVDNVSDDLRALLDGGEE